jgi:hypothetical protein
MTIEERVRRVLAEAVAAEPAPSGAPFEQVIRRRRRRPVLAAVVVMALLLAVAVVVAGLGAVDTKPVPVAPAVPPDWKTFQSSRYNLQFRYPPDWVVEQEGGMLVVPRELSPSSSKPSGSFAVVVGSARTTTTSSSRTAPR